MSLFGRIARSKNPKRLPTDAELTSLVAKQNNVQPPPDQLAVNKPVVNQPSNQPSNKSENMKYI